MGMRIGSRFSPTATQSSSIANWQQRQQTFKTLLSDIQSGDLNGAKQAFSALNGNNSTQGNSPLAKIGQALQNGDLAGAQQAVQALLASRRGGSSPSSSSSSIGDSSSGTPGVGSLINFSA